MTTPPHDYDHDHSIGPVSGMFSRRAFLVRTGIVAGSIAITASALPATGVGAQDFEASAIYEPGENVMIATDMLNIRAEPGLGGAVLATYPYGTVGNVNDGPVDADNYRWYQVAILGEVTGWAAGVYLTTTTSDGGGTGRPAIVVVDGPVNLRDAPGLSSNIIGTYPTGATGTYQGTGRSVEADGYEWIDVRMDNDGQFGVMATAFITET